MSLNRRQVATLAARTRGKAWLDRLRGRDPFAAHFDAHRCVFIHIPKTAGSSICQTLFGRQVGHIRYAYLLHHNRRKAQDYFSFAFVRHPVDRFVSAYQYLAAGGDGVNDGVGHDWVHRYSDINAFCQQALRPEFVYSGPVIHFRPQYLFICDDHCGPPQVDFVGRFEHLLADYARVQETLGHRIPLVHANATQSEAKRTLSPTELSDASRAHLAQIYATDFEQFGYSP